ncbi:unnamed protein product [Gongylonema pulchrum]|uniref:Trehalase n=1 Tax=Gongylonema pulchrum TaxID=637853 RepID=A0A183D9E1_9BILA|nr:unnamed protein product [Gongylonema pulchrum]
MSRCFIELQFRFIYCSGKLLEAVNIHKLELDWKTFVDRPMKKDPKMIQKQFEKQFGKQKVEDINPQELLAFRDLYFDEPGAELEQCTPTNWQNYPPKIMMIENKELREFALNLNERWKLLCRRVSFVKARSYPALSIKYAFMLCSSYTKLVLSRKSACVYVCPGAFCPQLSTPPLQKLGG